MSTAAGTSTIDVAVNLLWCVPGEVGGSEEYLVRQLIGLAAQPSNIATTAYCLPSFVAAHPELERLIPMVPARIDGEDRKRRIVAEHTWLARATRSADVVHHGGGTTPLIGGRPIVLTIHDLQYETYPDYTSASKLRYLRAMMPRSVARASVVAVPTEYVRSTVIDRFDVDPERVVVVRHGVEPDIGRGARTDDELREAYELGTGRVLVLPAITHPHKGHEFLLEVMAAHWDDPDLRLVLLGGRGLADGDVERAIVRLGLGDRVIRPGRVSADDRDGLIRLAHALVFPSQYEGFGAPVVEAMALGTPVVCSDQAALVEVVADAGLVLPLNRDAWAGALEHVETEREAMCRAGQRRSADFTALESGVGLARAYHLAAGR